MLRLKGICKYQIFFKLLPHFIEKKYVFRESVFSFFKSFQKNTFSRALSLELISSRTFKEDFESWLCNWNPEIFANLRSCATQLPGLCEKAHCLRHLAALPSVVAAGTSETQTHGHVLSATDPTASDHQLVRKNLELSESVSNLTCCRWNISSSTSKICLLSKTIR